jgi:hypothetical protein
LKIGIPVQILWGFKKVTAVKTHLNLKVLFKGFKVPYEVIQPKPRML